jgi:hypothetical protein
MNVWPKAVLPSVPASKSSRSVAAMETFAEPLQVVDEEAPEQYIKESGNR